MIRAFDYQGSALKLFSCCRYLFIVVTVVFLQACTTTAVDDTPPDIALSKALWKENRAILSTITDWKLKGKMAVKTGRKGGSATLKWNYLDEQQDIELYGPFGGGRVIIESDASGAVLRDTKGRVIEGETPDDVLYQRLGWQVPFNELQYWARGIPNETASKIKIDRLGRLKSLEQGNWMVEYQDYRKISVVSDGETLELEMPRKLLVSALPGTMEIYTDDGEYIGDELSVKIILKRWWNIQMSPSAT